jgi:ergothioneine biosynthesis protein EgtB
MAFEMTSLARSPVARDSVPSEVATWTQRYQNVRRWTETLCEPLEPEDYVIQSMPDASPVKWHLAHTSWFLETFILEPFLAGYRCFHPQFRYLFNSYYEAVGPRWPRPQRGILSRPTVTEVHHYRRHVDEHMATLMHTVPERDHSRVEELIELGLNHEQQHQELILTDLKHALAQNPLQFVYRPGTPATGQFPTAGWESFPEGLVWVGHAGPDFCYDNERPRHRALVQSFRLARRLVTNGEYLEFMEDGGYDRPHLWLSDGWAARQTHGWNAPLYWEKSPADWFVRSLTGCHPLNPSEPVCHVSYYEADAYVRWAGARLPTEAEWETAAGAGPLAGHFLETARWHPSPAAASDDSGPMFQMFGDVWQWTGSPYVGYPGYQPPAGAVGEYNGKFMCNQMVLRGASCATPRSHARPTYRNFFPPEARWQFTGIRLAQDL